MFRIANLALKKFARLHYFLEFGEFLNAKIFDFNSFRMDLSVRAKCLFTTSSIKLSGNCSTRISSSSTKKNCARTFKIEHRVSKSSAETNDEPVSSEPICFALTPAFSANCSCERPEFFLYLRRFLPNNFFAFIYRSIK